ncbi:MAG: hypothetical protein JSS49_28980 [Planctomycetes bacterium]|nr:hypothetical protein [Planctomycetota bacterium]
MQNLMTMTFEAHHGERNHHRRYQIIIGRDIFQDITVSIYYGRTARGGQEIRYGGMPSVALQSIIHDRLHRRLSANRRIGCRYQLTALESASGFDGSGWLPSSILAGFVD